MTKREIERLDMIMIGAIHHLWVSAVSLDDAREKVRRFVARRRASWPFANANEVILVCQTYFENPRGEPK